MNGWQADVMFETISAEEWERLNQIRQKAS